MRERGILFSGPMVKAILAGAKTVTRRTVKAAPGRQSTFLTPELLNASPRAELASVEEGIGAQFEHPRGGPLTWVRCPYGSVGDRLWVRETFAEHEVDDVQGTRAFYRADHADGECQVRPGMFLKWTPGIHMPRVVSRITLEIVSVRVERLHAIDDADARREGVALAGRTTNLGPREDFAALWDAINGERAPWTSNPWVWRVEFKVAEVRRG